MKRTAIAVLLMIMIAGILIGCSESEPGATDLPVTPATAEPEAPAPAPDTPDEPAQEAPEPEDEVISAGVSLYYRRDEWYKDLENAFFMAAEREGINIDVQDADTDPAKQAQQLEDFVTKRYNAVAFAPAAPDALVPVAQAASDAGVGVFIFDGYMDEPFVDANVIFDFAQCGVDLGNAVIQWVDTFIPDKEVVNVAIIDLPISTQVGVPIINNFKDTVGKDSRFEIVAQQDGKADRSVAMSVMENILTAQRNEVDIIIGNNWDAAMGGLMAAEAAGIIDTVAGFSPFWSEEGFLKLENDEPGFKGGISYSPLILGDSTVKAIVDHFTVGLPQRDVVSPSMTLTTANIHEFDWRAVVDLRN